MKFTASAILAAVFCVPYSHSFTPATKISQSASFRAQEQSKGLSQLNVASMSPKTEPTVATVPKVAQRWRKSTKQLITLGPASSTSEMIEKLFLAGADVFRLNFSHGSQEQKKELLMTIREIEEKYSHPIGILGDLQGPKLRVSFFVISSENFCHV